MPDGVWSVRHNSVAAVTCVAQPKDAAANRHLPMECVCAACLIFTLSLALSHKGRGDTWIGYGCNRMARAEVIRILE